jgi:L-lactate permease
VTLTTVKVLDVVLYSIIAWYIFQIASRKKGRLWFKTKCMIVSLLVYWATANLLLRQSLPPIEAAVIAGLVGLGASWVLVKAPKRDRRIPKATRRQVIERDLTSKGLAWDPAKYHIDHVVPFSRGGDHSARNLKVIEKRQNLRKGDRMPRLRDFFKRA